MSQYVRFSLTGVLSFPQSSKSTLSQDAFRFKQSLKGFLLVGNSLLPKEVSVTMNKVNDLGFIIRTEDEKRDSLSYQLSILAHVDSLSHKEVDAIIHSAIKYSLSRYKASLVIFSSVSEEKYSKQRTVRLGSYYHYNQREGRLEYVSDYDFQS